MVDGAKSERSIPARAMPGDAGNQADMAAAAASPADVPGRRAAPAPPDPRERERERSPRSRRARSASPRQRDRNEEGGIGILFQNLVTDQQEDRKRIIALEKMITQMQMEEDPRLKETRKDVKELQNQFTHDTFAKHMNNATGNKLNELVAKVQEIDNAAKLLDDVKDMVEKETTKLQLNLGDLTNTFNFKINRIELYLGDLEATRPAEGRTVVGAFAYFQAQLMKVQNDMAQLAVNVQQAAPAAPAAASSGATSSGSAAGLGFSEGGAYMLTCMTHETELRKIRGATTQQSEKLQTHDVHLDALQLQLDSLAETTRVVIAGQLVQAAADGAGPLFQAAVAGPLLQAASSQAWRCPSGLSSPTGHPRPEAVSGTGHLSAEPALGDPLQARAHGAGHPGQGHGGEVPGFHDGPAHGAGHPGQGHGGGVPGFPGGLPDAPLPTAGSNGGGFPTGPGGGGRGGPPGGS